MSKCDTCKECRWFHVRIDYAHSRLRPGWCTRDGIAQEEPYEGTRPACLYFESKEDDRVQHQR